MKLFRIALVVLAASFSAGIAHGSLIDYSVVTYNLVGATTSGGLLSGTIGINTATGLVQSADLTFNDSSMGTPAFTTVASTAAYNGLGQDWISGGSSGSLNYGGQAALYFNTANLSSGGDLSLCTTDSTCGTHGGDASYVEVYTAHGDAIFDLSSGTLSQGNSTAAATPEPPALVMVGTGAFALAGLCALVHAKAAAAAE